jgi:uncharacterized membrane protein YbhN (UPF0104 family)
MKKNKFIYIVLSVVVSILLFWLLFSRIRAEDVISTLSRIYIPGLLIYMAVALAGALLRAWRYKWLLRPQPVGWGNILLVTFIRNSLIDLLPARLGSLSFIYVLNRRLNFAFEAAASTFVVAFVFDFLTLSPFLIAAVLAVGLGTSALSTPALLAVSAVFFVAIGLGLWKIVPLCRLFLVIFRRFLGLFKIDTKESARLATEKLELTIRSLAAIQQRNIFFPIFILSLFIRLGKYISIYFLFFSLLRSHGFSLADLSFWTFILGISGAELSSALPIKGLAGFGTWESAWALTFRLMNFEPQLAIISGIGVHLLTNTFEYSLGIASILILAWPYLGKKGREHDRL